MRSTFFSLSHITSLSNFHCTCHYLDPVIWKLDKDPKLGHFWGWDSQPQKCPLCQRELNWINFINPPPPQDDHQVCFALLHHPLCAGYDAEDERTGKIQHWGMRITAKCHKNVAKYFSLIWRRFYGHRYKLILNLCPPQGIDNRRCPVVVLLYLLCGHPGDFLWEGHFVNCHAGFIIVGALYSRSFSLMTPL